MTPVWPHFNDVEVSRQNNYGGSETVCIVQADVQTSDGSRLIFQRAIPRDGLTSGSIVEKAAPGMPVVVAEFTGSLARLTSPNPLPWTALDTVRHFRKWVLMAHD